MQTCDKKACFPQCRATCKHMHSQTRNSTSPIREVNISMPATWGGQCVPLAGHMIAAICKQAPGISRCRPQLPVNALYSWIQQTKYHLVGILRLKLPFYNENLTIGGSMVLARIWKLGAQNWLLWNIWGSKILRGTTIYSYFNHKHV